MIFYDSCHKKTIKGYEDKRKGKESSIEVCYSFN